MDQLEEKVSQIQAWKVIVTVWSLHEYESHSFFRVTMGAELLPAMLSSVFPCCLCLEVVLCRDGEVQVRRCRGLG